MKVYLWCDEGAGSSHEHWMALTEDGRALEVAWHLPPAEVIRKHAELIRNAEGEQASAERRREIAAMNARTYAMSAADRERWFAAHPVSMFEEMP